MKRKILIWGFCLTLMVLAFSGCSAQKAEPKSYQKTIATARTEIWNAISAGGASHRRRWIYAALARRYSRAKSSTKR